MRHQRRRDGQTEAEPRTSAKVISYAQTDVTASLLLLNMACNPISLVQPPSNATNSAVFLPGPHTAHMSATQPFTSTMTQPTALLSQLSSGDGRLC